MTSFLVVTSSNFQPLLKMNTSVSNLLNSSTPATITSTVFNSSASPATIAENITSIILRNVTQLMSNSNNGSLCSTNSTDCNQPQYHPYFPGNSSSPPINQTEFLGITLDRAPPRLPFDKDLLRAFLVALYGFIFMVGVPGNILVILTIIRVPKMRSSKNLLMANIAFGDLVSILWCLTTALHGLYAPWPYGEVVCRYLNPMSDVIIGNTVFTIVVISFERYRAIISPFSSSKPSLRRTILAIILFWVISYVLIGLPLVKATRLRQYGFWAGRVCGVAWPSRTYEVTYRVAIFLCVFVAPCVTVLYCFVQIKRRLEENIRFATMSLRGRSTLKRAKRNQRLIKMLLVIFVCFTSCFLPVNALLLAFTFFKESMASWPYLVIVFQLVIAVLFLNSVMNPVILYMLSR